MKPWEEVLKHGDVAKILIACEVYGINTEDQYGMTALEVAMDMHRLDIARILIKKGANLSSVRHTWWKQKDT